MPRPFLSAFRSVAFFSALVSLSAVGCQTYGSQLQRGQGYYEQHQYENALAVFRHLEADQDSLSQPEVVRYCYLRGMTDFRLGFRSHSRYWLGLARAGLNRSQFAVDGVTPTLNAEETARLDETLTELSQEVFGLKPKADSAPAKEVFGDRCQYTTDCDSGFTCQAGICVQAAPIAAGASNAPAPVAE